MEASLDKSPDKPRLVAEFEIKSLPAMTNKIGRKHWTVKHKESVKWKSLVAVLAAKHDLTNLGLASAALTLSRHSSVEPDFDGLVSGFKHIIDGLVAANVIRDDKQATIGQPTYNWFFNPKRKGGFVTIKIETREERSW